MKIRIKRYHDGATVGTVRMRKSEWQTYADCKHPAYQWPEGLARAGDVLDRKTLDRLGIDPGETIWLDD